MGGGWRGRAVGSACGLWGVPLASDTEHVRGEGQRACGVSKKGGGEGAILGGDGGSAGVGQAWLVWWRGRNIMGMGARGLTVGCVEVFAGRERLGVPYTPSP